MSGISKSYVSRLLKIEEHAAVHDQRGVILDVEVTTGELNERRHIVERVDRTAERIGTAVTTVTADAR